MSQNRVKLLFAVSFFAMIAVYLAVFGKYKTVSIIVEEYIFILTVIPLFMVSFLYKRRLKGMEVIDFNANSNLTLKNTLLFFLVFQVMDYIYEDGFAGMVSQWFIYWIMGIITVIILDIINTYKNLKLVRLREQL